MAFGLQSWPQPSRGIGVAYKWNDVNAANALYFVVDMGDGDQVILVGVSLASLGTGWIS